MILGVIVVVIGDIVLVIVVQMTKPWLATAEGAQEAFQDHEIILGIAAGVAIVTATGDHARPVGDAITTIATTEDPEIIDQTVVTIVIDLTAEDAALKGAITVGNEEARKSGKNLTRDASGIKLRIIPFTHDQSQGTDPIDT